MKRLLSLLALSAALLRESYPGNHAIGTFLVISGVFKRLDQGDKPDPVTEARLEERRAHGAR